MDIDALASQFQSHVQGLSDLGFDFPSRGMVNIRGLMRPASTVLHQLDAGEKTDTDIAIPHERGPIPHGISVRMRGGDIESMTYRPARASSPESHLILDPNKRIRPIFSDRVKTPEEFMERLPEKMGSYEPSTPEEAEHWGYGKDVVYEHGGRHLVQDWSTFDLRMGGSPDVDTYTTDPHPVNLERIPPEERRK